MKKSLYIFVTVSVLVLILSGCATELPAAKAVENVSWEIVDTLYDMDEQSIAVYYFTENGEPSDFSDYLINSLTSQIASAVNEEELKHKVVSRQALDRILKEMEFQLSALADEESQAAVGRQLGADLILTGTISKEYDIYVLNAQLIDVETGVVLDGFITRMWWDG
jgi:TolB-like protein